MFQCDGKPLALTEGPQLQGIALLNIPSTHGGTNMWGDSTVKTRQQRKKSKRAHCVLDKDRADLSGANQVRLSKDLRLTLTFLFIRTSGIN